MSAACTRPAESATSPLALEREAARAALDEPRMRGNPHANVVVSFWFDYDCSFCATASTMLDEIANRYGDRIVIRYMNYPMNPWLHPFARDAAIAAEAARLQGRYFEMHRLLVARAPDLSPRARRAAARELGLDMASFDADVADAIVAARVDRDEVEGNMLRLAGVPSIFVDGVQIHRPDVDSVASAIDVRLQASSTGSP